MRLADERGSAVAEFAMVAGLLVVLVLSVMQLSLALHVRATVADAAAEGARHASLLGSDAAAGVERTRELISTAIGPRYAERVSASSAVVAGLETIEIRVAAPLPVLGFIGPVALEVAGHAPVESLR
ncbi:TadE/TadG family type IV pilus assembly protein [Agrococcus sp. Marseille-Q4369]|uniref:TadE/TadG family type IV pilus assembly protein n=1 Tax=unclassified Agrococcus TaxID=2615065 RepID=UPI001B8D1C3B|nr:TadE/TadG family type IV pilus assembly protein [Agrococcus sp. Marseille-Q4369]QUW18912.1 pilus assembly protein [Agrococcus sp. Marseille-Q4369]